MTLLSNIIYNCAMATHTITHVLDDLDNSEGAETRTFSIEGVMYEIDLVDANNEKLRKAVEPFVSAARRVRGSTISRAVSASTRTPSLATQKGYTTDEIRSWAKSQGMDINDRGRISNDIVEMYDAAKSAKPVAVKEAPAKPVEAKKAPARKAPARKAPAKKAAAKKATASASAASD